MKLFKDYIEEIENFYRDNGVEIDPIPSVKLDKTEQDEFDPFIKTAHYNPENSTITLFINNRHLKDILRSFCHELIHHNQKLRYGDLEFMKINKSGKLNENDQLNQLESEAYQKGNLMFRNWTEKYTH